MRKIVRRPLRPGVAAPDPSAQDGDAADDDLPGTAADPAQAQVEPPPERSPPAADWAEADLPMPRTKRLISLRIDADVLEYFQRSGKGYQTRMNAVLRVFMDARNRR